MLDAVETRVSDAPPLRLFEQRVEQALAVFRSEIESEAVAIARLLGDLILQPRHVEKAVFNILHHHRLGPTLKDLLHECDVDGEVLDEDATDVWEDEDDDSEDEAWDLEDRVGLTEDYVDG